MYIQSFLKMQLAALKYYKLQHNIMAPIHDYSFELLHEHTHVAIYRYVKHMEDYIMIIDMMIILHNTS